ncbi:MAG: hypothetical protein CL677_03070 [Bdellovibrionaceae bacterium]|nr:hypothetical protein [Pseudobdellovibrionaceae bacterium]
MKILVVFFLGLAGAQFTHASGPSGEQEATKVFDYEKAPASSDDDGLGDILHDDSLTQLDPTASGIDSSVSAGDFVSPRGMYEFCATEFGSSTMNNCITTVKGHQFSSNSLEVCKLHSDQAKKLSCLEIVKDGILTDVTRPICTKTNPDLNGCIENIMGKVFENDSLLLCKENGGSHLNSCLEAISRRTFNSHALSVCALNVESYLVDCIKLIRDFDFDPDVEICRRNGDPAERAICTMAFNRHEDFNTIDARTVWVKIENTAPFEVSFSGGLLASETIDYYKSYLSLVIGPALSHYTGKINEVNYGWTEEQMISYKTRKKHYRANDYWKSPDRKTAITKHLIEVLRNIHSQGHLYSKTYH